MKLSMMIVICLVLMMAGCQVTGDRKSLSRQGQGQVKKAMTWTLQKKDPELGIVLLGIGGGDPYHGDTPVTESLPVLAIKKENLPRPNYAVDQSGGGMAKEYYRGWSGGRVKLTPPIRGTELTSLEAADEYCSRCCGEGYRMAEFHDGLVCPGMERGRFYGDTWPCDGSLRRGGWSFWTYGEVSADGRFWVSIDDQDANCWEMEKQEKRDIIH